jgi:hypothetical protein
MITQKRFLAIVNSASEAWRKDRRELLSCFDSEKLWERIHAYVDLTPDSDLSELTKSLDFGEPNKRSVLRSVISEELIPDQEGKLEAAIGLALDRAFLTLCDRGALKNLSIVDEIPARAQADMDLISANVAAAAPKKVVQVAPPVPPVDPVQLCVQDFHELGSKAFQAKYLSNTNNRKFYEAAIDRGLL